MAAAKPIILKHFQWSCDSFNMMSVSVMNVLVC